jgi:hypothetical protein
MTAADIPFGLRLCAQNRVHEDLSRFWSGFGPEKG